MGLAFPETKTEKSAENAASDACHLRSHTTRGSHEGGRKGGETRFTCGYLMNWLSEFLKIIWHGKLRCWYFKLIFKYYALLLQYNPKCLLHTRPYWCTISKITCSAQFVSYFILHPAADQILAYWTILNSDTDMTAVCVTGYDINVKFPKHTRRIYTAAR